jgi:hypothetical protein
LTYNWDSFFIKGGSDMASYGHRAAGILHQFQHKLFSYSPGEAPKDPKNNLFYTGDNVSTSGKMENKNELGSDR